MLLMILNTSLTWVITLVFIECQIEFRRLRGLLEKAFDKNFFLFRLFMKNMNVYMILAAFQGLGFIANVKNILMFQREM